MRSPKPWGCRWRPSSVASRAPRAWCPTRWIETRVSPHIARGLMINSNEGNMRHPEALAEGLSPRAAEVAELARQHLGHMSDRQREAILNAVRSKMSERRQGRTLRRSVWMVAAASSCAAIAALGVSRHHGRTEPLSFRVEGADLNAGGYVEAGPASRPVLRFSDGSEVALTEASRVHVHSVDEHGAQVTLDEGHAHAYITHAVATHWSFEAGPFVVNVTGTAFGISWGAEGGRLDVRLEDRKS